MSAPTRAQLEALTALLGQLSLPGERWAPVPGYEATYQVSTLGRVYSTPRPTTRGGLLSISVDNYGYPKVALVQNGRQRNFKTHILVMLAFVGPPPKGMEVRHLDGSRNPRLDNLTYGTHKENGEDAAKHGVNKNVLSPQCGHGHTWDEANTYRWRGRRMCRKCNLARYHANKMAS